MSEPRGLRPVNNHVLTFGCPQVPCTAMVPCEMVRVGYSDHYEGFARLWLPPEPRGAVLYLHGIQSHGLWFEASAGRLAEAGLAVLLPDRRGSGRNELDRGHTPSARRLLRDAAECLDDLHVRTRLDRFHVLGVSWGGKLALALLGYVPKRVTSLTLVTPGLFPRVGLSWGQKVRAALSAMVARRSLFDVPLDQPGLFTANVQRQQFIRDDPLALHRVTASFLLASRRLDVLARATRKYPTGCPLHVFLAGQDRIIDNAATKAFLRRLHRAACTITEYEQAQHTLEFEPDPEPFLADLAGWFTSLSGAAVAR